MTSLRGCWCILPFPLYLFPFKGLFVVLFIHLKGFFLSSCKFHIRLCCLLLHILFVFLVMLFWWLLSFFMLSSCWAPLTHYISYRRFLVWKCTKKIKDKWLVATALLSPGDEYCWFWSSAAWLYKKDLWINSYFMIDWWISCVDDTWALDAFTFNAIYRKLRSPAINSKFVLLE